MDDEKFELKSLIRESKEMLAKLRKILNTMLVVGGIIFIPFLYSFVDVQVQLSHLKENSVTKEEFKESNDEAYRIFVQKVDALAVLMYEHDWNRTQFYKITHDESYKKSEVKVLIESFFSDKHRSGGE